MLQIDNKEVKITKQNIFVGHIKVNNVNGFNIVINIEFLNILTNKKGYINLDVGFEKTNNINNFINKEYKDVNMGFTNQHIFLEVFDTENFFDSEIENDIIIKIEEIVENKVKVFFEVNEDFIVIKYDGYLDVVDKDNIEKLN